MFTPSIIGISRSTYKDKNFLGVISKYQQIVVNSRFYKFYEIRITESYPIPPIIIFNYSINFDILSQLPCVNFTVMVFKQFSLFKNKVSLQTSLKRNSTNLSYIFILSVNFENLTVRLHVLITSLMLTKFQENQRLITMSSNKCYNFKFL